MVERETNKARFFVLPNRSRPSILRLIEANVSLLSRAIMTDGHKSYPGMIDLGFNHYAVNHSINFVHPVELEHLENER